MLCPGSTRPFISMLVFFINACKAAISSFSSCYISLVLGSVNVVAHSLASSAVTQTTIP